MLKSKRGVILLFLFFGSLIANAQNKNNIFNPNPQSSINVRGDLYHTSNGNVTVSLKADEDKIRKGFREDLNILKNELKTILKEFSIPKGITREEHNKKELIDKSLIEKVFANQDTSAENYSKTCEYLQSEIRINTEKNFPLAVEQALNLEKLAKARKDSQLLANNYAMLFFMYVSKDFNDLAISYENLADSMTRKIPFNEKYTLSTLDLLSNGNFVLNNYRKVIKLEEYYLPFKLRFLSPMHESIAKSYFTIGRIHNIIKENSDSVILYIEKSIKIIKTYPDHSGIEYLSKLYVLWGLGLYKKTHNLEESYSYIQKAMFVAQKHNDSINITYYYHPLGFLESEKKNYSLAINHYKKSIELKKKYQLPNKSIVHSCYNLASIYKDMGKYDSAYMFFSESLYYLNQDKEEDVWYKMWVYYYLGRNSTNRQQHQTCINNLKKAGEYFKTNYSPKDWYTRDIYFYLGKRYNNLGKYDSAILYLDSAIHWTYQYDKKFTYFHFYFWDRSISYSNKGNLHYALKDIDTAIFYYHNQSNHKKNDLISLLNMQSGYYYRLRDYRMAIKSCIDILQVINFDSLLYKEHYINTINNITNYCYLTGDTLTSNYYLLKFRDYLEVIPYDDFTYVSYGNCAVYAEKLKNYSLELFFLAKERKAIKKNSKLLQNHKNDLIFQNELSTIVVKQKINNKYNAWNQISQLEKTLKNTSAKYYDNFVDIYFGKIIFYPNPNDLEGLIKISNGLKEFMTRNKDKISYDQLLKSELMVAMVEIPKLINESEYTIAKTKIHKFISGIKQIAKDKNRSIDILGIKQIFLPYAKYIIDEKEKENFIKDIQNY